MLGESRACTAVRSDIESVAICALYSRCFGATLELRQSTEHCAADPDNGKSVTTMEGNTDVEIVGVKVAAGETLALGDGIPDID